MTTALDYFGRTVDVVAFPGAVERGEVRLGQALADSAGGFFCTGIVKLSQRWLTRFLLERGSMKFRPDDGTDFLASLRNGRIRSQSQLFTAFAFAAGLVSRQLLSEELEADPADEKYARATLDRVVLAPGSVKLYISITSQAGDARQVILPIRTLNVT